MRSPRLYAAVAALAVCTVFAGASFGAGKTYVSHRYHYALALPAGWLVLPATSTLSVPAFPEANGPETDRFDSATKDRGTIGIASAKLPAGKTLSAWVHDRVGSIATSFDCFDPQRHTRTVAGVKAVELVYPSCFGYFDDLELVHGGRGYDIYWLGSKATGGDAVFLRSLAGFRFHA